MSEAGVLTTTQAGTAEAAAGSTPTSRARWMFWRSPADQPRWARPALLGVAALAAVLYSWNIRQSGYATFYSVAVKSMSVSWKAFFFGALDPGATITIDKLAGSFLPQALSARIFGYHQWSLTLPQVIEGVVSVLAMYRLVRRPFGPVAGLLGAGLFALTPIAASMFGHPMEDGALTMCLVLAADAFVRALAEARLRSLVLAGVWVGLGFQAKMLQAWMVLPALVLTYLIAAPTGWRRRLGHLSVAGGVMVAVSLSWILVYTVTPAGDRPYVDGSTNNNAFSMVFGYNGLDRFGIQIPGSVQSMFTGGGRTAAGGPPTGQTPGSTGSGNASPAANRAFGPGGQGGGLFGSQGRAKLLGQGYASQVGWLYPLALAGLAVGLIRYRRGARRADPADGGRAASRLAWGGYLLFGLWLATYAAIFSRITLPHTAYLASLAPPVAGLSAGGLVLLWRGYRERDRGWRWALPATIVVESAWTGYLATRYTTFLPWLTWLVLGAAVLALLVLITGALPRRVLARALVPAMALGCAAMVAVPSAWALSVLDTRYGGSAFDASAGPGGRMGGFGGAGTGGQLAGRDETGGSAVNGGTANGGGFPGGELPGGGVPGGGEFPGGGFPGNGTPANRASAGPFGGGGDTLTAAQRRLDSYLTAHRDGARFVAATPSWSSAGPYITATGQPFLPMGGFSGTVPQPTLRAVQQMVSTGRLRYFLLGGAGGFGAFGGPDGGGTSEVSRITTWVQSTCATVAASDYGGDGQQNLYRCG